MDGSCASIMAGVLPGTRTRAQPGSWSRVWVWKRAWAVAPPELSPPAWVSGDENHRRSKEHERERSCHQDSCSEDDYSQEEESWLPVWHKSSKNKCCWILSSSSFNLLTFAGSLPPLNGILFFYTLILFCCKKRMFLINLRLTRFLKSGLVIASGLLERVTMPGSQCLFSRAYKEKFQIFYLILMVEL